MSQLIRVSQSRFNCLVHISIVDEVCHASVPPGYASNLTVEVHCRQDNYNTSEKGWCMTTIVTMFLVVCCYLGFNIMSMHKQTSPWTLKTAGGDTSSVIGFTVIASNVALTGAATLLA